MLAVGFSNCVGFSGDVGRALAQERSTDPADKGWEHTGHIPHPTRGTALHLPLCTAVQHVGGLVVGGAARTVHWHHVTISRTSFGDLSRNAVIQWPVDVLLLLGCFLANMSARLSPSAWFNASLMADC